MNRAIGVAMSRIEKGDVVRLIDSGVYVDRPLDRGFREEDVKGRWIAGEDIPRGRSVVLDDQGLRVWGSKNGISH